MANTYNATSKRNVYKSNYKSNPTVHQKYSALDSDDLDDLFDELGASSFETSLQLPDPSLMQYYKDLSDRKVYLIQDVSESILEIEKMILTWNSEDEKNKIPVEERKPIKFYIYSYGGDGCAALSLINVIQISKTPINIYCLGIAMSAAALILVSGKKGHRYILKDSTILIHQGQSNVGGTAQAVLAQTEDYKRFLRVMKNIVLNNTNIDKSLYAKMEKKEWFIYSDQALKYGCVDHVVEDISEII